MWLNSDLARSYMQRRKCEAMLVCVMPRCVFRLRLWLWYRSSNCNSTQNQSEPGLSSWPSCGSVELCHNGFEAFPMQPQ
ncbi:hypothetical protein L596_020157 [Steinernema carpocapsae]|uniref:Uncharacterized protein n=1 Tax=Steinernema carpocapsae TaxID=34508 RepID=A0A4U5MSQ3_STECR|nr:hypothetical protein L596_020157 [Steinernema carpocapsae]